MKTTIQNTIANIELERGIKVLLACETGSRAWGFPSPDSDYDVRLIYVHPKDWYVSVSEKKDNFEMMLNGRDLDITGWDLRKSLRLLTKSNASLLERIQSPIIYKGDTLFVEEITHLSRDLYSPISTIHHYLSMAKKCLFELEKGDELNLKKLFYALRSVLACLWILDKNTNPPILFQTMLNELDFDLNLKNKIRELIALKLTKNEVYQQSKDKDLLNFIKSLIVLTTDQAKSLKGARKKNIDIDKFLLKCVS